MNENWQQQALESLLKDSIREQRSRRRWGIFFKLFWGGLILLVLLIILASSMNDDPERHMSGNKPHTALINVNGPIMPNSNTDADNVNRSLKAAFDAKGTKGVIIRLNSPGGSPVQSDYIYREIRYLQGKHPKIKVYAVCRDICASGAYYIAAAANEIYADPNSMVGSIGVIAGGFGFVNTMKKIGVERRIFTAGTQKDFLDSFAPLKPQQVKEMHVMLDQLHHNFIQAVKDGRGNRLKQDKDMFSGRIWTGVQAKQLGLIDNFGDETYLANDVIKAKDIINYTYRPTWIERMAGTAGVSAAQEFAKTIGFTQHMTVNY